MAKLPYDRVIRLEDGALDPKAVQDDFAWINEYLDIEPRLAIGSTGAPAFENSWTNYGSGFQTAGYYRWGNHVFLEGLVNRGAAALTLTTIFTLPSNVRPSLSHIFTASATGAYARVDVQAAGAVVMLAGTLGAGGAASWLSLSGINFRVD